MRTDLALVLGALLVVAGVASLAAWLGAVILGVFVIVGALLLEEEAPKAVGGG